MNLTGNKTMWAYQLEQSILLNKEYYPLPNTTLNEKFNIATGYTIEPYEYPRINLLTIGTGLNELIQTTDYDFLYSVHNPLHGSLYNHIPFKIHKDNELLTSEEASIYRLKSNITIGTETYIAYYGLKINNIIDNSSIKVVNTNNILSNIKLDTAAEPGILYPDKNDISIAGNYCMVSSIVQIDFTDTIFNNLQYVISKLKENNLPYIITELGICSSVDYNIGERIEALWTQILYFLNLRLDISQRYQEYIESNIPFSINISISGNEPIKV